MMERAPVTVRYIFVPLLLLVEPFHRPQCTVTMVTNLNSLELVTHGQKSQKLWPQQFLKNCQSSCKSFLLNALLSKFLMCRFLYHGHMCPRISLESL